MPVQTQEQRYAVITAWEHSKWFPQGLLRTEHNFRTLAEAIEDIPELTITDLVTVVARLGDIAKGGKLQYASVQPQVIEKIVEVEKPKSKAEIARELRDTKNALGLGSHKTELDARPSKGQAKMVANSDEMAKIAFTDLNNNKIMGEVRSIIGRYIGKSHARTFSTREILTSEMNSLVKQGATPADIKAAVIKKMNALDGTASHKAFREAAR